MDLGETGNRRMNTLYESTNNMANVRASVSLKMIQRKNPSQYKPPHQQQQPQKENLKVTDIDDDDIDLIPPKARQPMQQPKPQTQAQKEETKNNDSFVIVDKSKDGKLKTEN